MCNIPFGGEQQPYGRDALVAGPVHEYDMSPDYSPSPEQRPFPPFFGIEEREYF